MNSIENPSFNPERKMALTREDLPPLKDGFVRAVHLTSAATAQEIAAAGLDYSKYGMLSSTARSWADESQVEYDSADPRYQSKDIVAVVMDIPADEHRLHERADKSPGVVPGERVVGIIPVKPDVEKA